MSGEMGEGGHDLRHAGLVVRAQQGVAARADQVVSHLVREIRHHGRVQHRATARQLERPAVVVPVDDRVDARGRGVRARVHVRDQPDRRKVAVDGCRKRRHHVAVPVQVDALQPDRLELADQHAREVELARGARALGAIASRLGVDANVAEEALEQLGGERLGKRGRERSRYAPTR